MAGQVGDWDFFISYTQADRLWAEWIAWVLEEDKHRVLIQAWDFVAGSNWLQSMQSGVTRADRTIAVLSAEYLESVFGAAEWQAAWKQDPDGEQRKLLTVRVEDCDRPGLLAGVVGIDVFGIDEAKATERLQRAVVGAAEGRMKPSERVTFPGRAMPRRARYPGSLPRYWNVRARNPNLVGRAADLRSVAGVLDRGSRVVVGAIHGMAGVGKTQLAIEYAHQSAARYDLVWWIDAEEAATIADQFSALALALGLEPGPDPDAIRTQVHHALRDVSGWLMVFDNADRTQTLTQWLPTAPQPPGVPGHVIVTTRRGGFEQLGRVLDVDVLELPAAVELLRGRLPTIDATTAEAIAKFLGRLPLGLEQAAAYMARTGTPPPAYLDLLTSRTAEMLGRVPGDRDRTHTLATVWQLSFERLRAESPAALQLMKICAYLAPEAIPLDLFTNHPDLLPEPLAQAAADDLAFNDVIAPLVDYSLAKRINSTLEIHRLVQAALRAPGADDLGVGHSIENAVNGLS